MCGLLYDAKNDRFISNRFRAIPLTRQTDERMETEGRTDGRTEGRTEGRTNGRMEGRTGERTDGRTDERSDGRANRRKRNALYFA